MNKELRLCLNYQIYLIKKRSLFKSQLGTLRQAKHTIPKQLN